MKKMVCWVLEIGVSTPHPPERLKHTLHILVLQLVDPFLGVTQRAKNQLEEAWAGIRRDKRKKNKTLQPKVLNIQVSSSVIIAQMDTMMRIFVCPSMNPTLFGKSARVLSDHGNLHSTVSVALYPVRNSRQCSLNCEFWG